MDTRSAFVTGCPCCNAHVNDVTPFRPLAQGYPSIGGHGHHKQQGSIMSCYSLVPTVMWCSELKITCRTWLSEALRSNMSCCGGAPNPTDPQLTSSLATLPAVSIISPVLFSFQQNGYLSSYGTFHKHSCKISAVASLIAKWLPSLALASLVTFC